MKTFDSWAWVEYFRGSAVGRKVKEILEGEEILLTPSICIAELKVKYLAEDRDPGDRLGFIKSRTSIISVDASVAEAAAELKLRHGLHMVDAVVLACARATRSDLLTGDRHFQGVPGVVTLGE